TTIRFETLAPGASPADTTPANWSAPVILRDYLLGDRTAFGWSGSEQMRAGGVDFLAGFTAWGPYFQGIAIARMNWQGTDFTLGSPEVSAVNEYRSPARGLQMRLGGYSPRGRSVTFQIDSPIALAAQLDVFDAGGRRVRSLLAGPLA